MSLTIFVCGYIVFYCWTFYLTGKTYKKMHPYAQIDYSTLTLFHILTIAFPFAWAFILITKFEPILDKFFSRKSRWFND